MIKFFIITQARFKDVIQRILYRRMYKKFKKGIEIEQSKIIAEYCEHDLETIRKLFNDRRYNNGSN